MHFGIIQFPGTNCELDCLHVVEKVLGHTGALVWHEEIDLSPFDALLLPGGFAHGDYLRTGAVARFSPVMDSVSAFSALGKPVLGICNGFQILCEAGLLPGALRRNLGQHFICRDVYLRVEANNNRFLHHTDTGQVLKMPIRHGEGNYYADDDTLAAMEANGQILLRYCDPNGFVTPESNPNGSASNIAGVMNDTGTIFGLMPHPEACAEAALGNTDGLLLFQALLEEFDTNRPHTATSGLLGV